MVFVAQSPEHAAAAGAGAYIEPDPIMKAIGGDLFEAVKLAGRPALQQICEWFDIQIASNARKDEIIPAVHAKIADGTITWASLEAKKQGVQVGPGFVSGAPALPDPIDLVAAEQSYREDLAGYTPFQLKAHLANFGAPTHKFLRKDEIVDMLVEIQIHGGQPELPERLKAKDETDGDEQHDVS